MTTASKALSRTVSLGATAMLIAGCGSAQQCVTLESLEAVVERSNIVVPEGLDNLDETRALKIPDATSPPPEEGRCIDEPPRFNEVGV